MILCLDAGNSRVKWGLRDGDRWRVQGTVAHGEVFALGGMLPQRPARAVACNVAGNDVATAIEALAAGLGAELRWLRSGPERGGISNGYDTPSQLGADRWAALIGARGRHPGACIVVMAGTATTVDRLDADGRFRGGLILPGLALMRAALAANTAGLPHAAGRYRELPTNTDDAIVAGSLHATLGAIDRLRTAAGNGIPVLLSGGNAGDLAAHVPAPCETVQNLVLEGLARIALLED